MGNILTPDGVKIIVTQAKYDELLTVPDVMAILKTSKNMVYSLLNSGRLPFLKLGDRKVRRLDLEKFLEEYSGYDLSDLNNPKKIARATAG